MQLKCRLRAILPNGKEKFHLLMLSTIPGKEDGHQDCSVGWLFPFSGDWPPFEPAGLSPLPIGLSSRPSSQLVQLMQRFA